MARKPTNADRVVIEGDSTLQFNLWVSLRTTQWAKMSGHATLLSDILGAGHRKSPAIVAVRRRLLTAVRIEWCMCREGVAGPVRVSREMGGEWVPLSLPVLARLLGYRDHSAVWLAIRAMRTADARAKTREREREAGVRDGITKCTWL